MPDKVSDIHSEIELLRISLSKTTKKETKSALGQFFTSFKLASYISDMFDDLHQKKIRLLDPGAGIGILTITTISYLCNQRVRPESIEVVAVEIDKKITPTLQQSLDLCKKICELYEVHFTYQLVEMDFIKYSVKLISNNVMPFNMVITNPPYKKISSKSKTRKLLSEIGIETTNLYTAFVSLSKRLLENGGQLAAITPRSFCNGLYFKPFRIDFLSDMSFIKFHVFETRNDAFFDENVLQENVIYLARKNFITKSVLVSSSNNLTDPVRYDHLEYSQFIHSDDKEKFIWVLNGETDRRIKITIDSDLMCKLQDLDLNVSTGKVVDFRTLKSLTSQQEDSVPLIYPFHFDDGFVRWPKNPTNKLTSIKVSDETKSLLVPMGNYVLVRRLSSKEEKRRINAVVYDASKINFEFIGFENRVNYYHNSGKGLPLDIAKGLVIYLSSTIVDIYFRQFNGLTQVNVTDLKSIPYPSEKQLSELGQFFKNELPSQQEIDNIVWKVTHISFR